MTPEEITKLAKSLCAASNPTMDDVWLLEDIIEGILRTHCIVGKEFVKRQRLAIEHDKKLMFEKPIGEKIALAGVYQAKLELMDKLFGSDTFNENGK